MWTNFVQGMLRIWSRVRVNRSGKTQIRTNMIRIYHTFEYNMLQYSNNEKKVEGNIEFQKRQGTKNILKLN
jgi:hypothetical protein